MMRPHPPRLRMKRRKTVSVTPAMGARTVAGEIVTVPIWRVAGTGFSRAVSRAGAPAPHLPLLELSQYFFTDLFYLSRKMVPRSGQGQSSSLSATESPAGPAQCLDLESLTRANEVATPLSILSIRHSQVSLLGS